MQSADFYINSLRKLEGKHKGNWHTTGYGGYGLVHIQANNENFHNSDQSDLGSGFVTNSVLSSDKISNKVSRSKV